MVFIKLLYRCVLLLLISSNSFGQLFLNEVCSYNASVLTDEDDDKPDWIELYNSGTNAINLQNYSLKCGPSEKWIFPSVILQPQQHLIVFASGKNRTSPNLHTNFKISKAGELLQLFDPQNTLTDEFFVPSLQMNHSFGLKPDGIIGSSGIFNIPTPAASNINSDQYSGYAIDPVFSIPAGYYNFNQQLNITTSPNQIIYFTTDGREPDENSQVFTSAISLDISKPVRARSYSTQNSLLPSKIITNSYLIDFSSDLPVISIATDPDNLWDWNTGIYVSGPNASPNYPYYGANFWQDWEIAANVEYFEADGQLKFSQSVGVKINGGSSNRSKPMKSLRLTNKSKYGEGGFKYKFFENKPIDDFKIIVLRNSSGDFNKTHFRDGSLHNLMIGKVNIDLAAYSPALVFLNGIYHGVHNIREKISKYYLKENFEIDINQVDLLEEDSLVIEGDFNAFNNMHSFITGNDMSLPQNFSMAESMIDTKSLCDYYIAETYLSNIDWPYNNLKLWKEHKPGAKWRYILIDLDISLGNNGWALADFDVLGRIMGTYGDNNRHVQIFRSLLQNKPFREYFINRYADLVNTIFTSENMATHILNIRNTLEHEMPLHFSVWGNDMSGWDNEIYQVAMPYIYDRPYFAMNQVKEVFNLTGITSLELDVWPPGAGIIHINTITPEPLPWKGSYFNGNPVVVSVEPNSGFHFTRWVSETPDINDPGNEVIRFNPFSDTRLTAFFSTSTDIDQLMLFPNPVADKLQIGFVLDHPHQGKLEIINSTGQILFLQDEVPLQYGINKLEYETKKLETGIYYIRIIMSDEIKQGKFIKM